MEQKKIKITIKLPEDKTLPLDVDPSDTILSIQTKIKEATGIEVQNQQIGVNFEMSKHISNVCYLPFETVEGLGLSDGAEVLCYHRKGGVKIYVRHNTETLSIDSDYYDSLYHVKELIAAEKGIPIERQRIVFAGKQLADNKKLQDYSITKESTLHLILRDE